MPHVNEYAIRDALICGSYMEDNEITCMAEELIAARALVAALRSDVGMNEGYISSQTLTALAHYEDVIK